jgi:hypothetical protein
MTLRPKVGKGERRCDLSIDLGGVRVFCEVKRFEDPFATDTANGWQTRAVVKASPGTPIAPDVIRPRSMDLVSKLENVPNQLPNDAVNVLFALHPGISDGHRHLEAALFGDAAWHVEHDAVGAPAPDGLFAREAWRVVSGCYLARVSPEHGVYLPRLWLNPHAAVPLPQPVRDLLASIAAPAGAGVAPTAP